MNLSQLYYFRKLAELQHYARAAQELHITQPSLSNAMSSLEAELGVALFQKVGRNSRLTKYGREFLTYVNDGLDVIDRGVAVMKSYAGSDDGGKIDLGCIITVQTDYVPRLLRDYRTFAACNVTMNVREDTSSVLAESLASGSCDVAIGARGDDRPGFEYIPVVAQRVIVAMDAASPLAVKEFLVPEDLVDVQPITYADSIPLGRAMKAMLASHGLTQVTCSYLDESILAGFAANGVEVAIMVDTFFLRSVEGVVVRPLYNNARERRSFYHRVYLAYNRLSYHIYRVDHFIDYVKAHKVLVDPEPNPLYID